MVRLIDADELKARIIREVEEAKRGTLYRDSKETDSKIPYVNIKAVIQMIDECPTRWEEKDGAYIPCEHGAYVCTGCKYHNPETGCQRPGGETIYDRHRTRYI